MGRRRAILTLVQRRNAINKKAQKEVLTQLAKHGSKAKYAKHMRACQQNINRWLTGLNYTDATLEKLSPIIYAERLQIKREILELCLLVRKQFSSDVTFAKAIGVSAYTAFLWTRGTQPNDVSLDKMEAIKQQKNY